MATPLQPIIDALSQLRTAWPKRGWSWDSRFSCVASTFDAGVADQCREIVLRALPTLWTDRTLAGAPTAVRELSERTGGVRGGQLVYTCDPLFSVQPFALWWPWGDGNTISLRIGFEARADYGNQLCEIFGAER